MDAKTFIALASSVLIGGALVFKKPTSGNPGTYPRRRRKTLSEVEKKEEGLAQLRMRIQDLDEAMEDAQAEERPEEEIKALWEEMKKAEEELLENKRWKELEARKPVYLGLFDD